MTLELKTIDLEINSVIDTRSVQNKDVISASDINQINGKCLVVERDNNRLIIYPQSPQSQIESPTILITFGAAGTLQEPLDAKWDYIRQKIWIADTGNHRILKTSSIEPIETNNVDIIIGNKLYYPHAIAVNINTGGCFVKGYDNLNQSTGSVIRFSSSGEELVKFTYDILSQGNLSSSESEANSSSSSEEMPNTPLPQSIMYDHVRNRVWWVNQTNIYMADMRNEQVKIFSISNWYTDTSAISVELSTGNAFVIVQNLHNESFVIQIFRDNNEILAKSWIEA